MTKLIVGTNDLKTKYPELAKEWNYEKNGDLKPEDVTYGSIKKVWWKCKKGHEWQATINCRTNTKSNCPYCCGRYAIKGETDLTTKYPEFAKEWNYEKNGDLKPENVTSGSHKKVWWKCNKGHEWQTTINSRSSGNNCPYCSNKKVLQGFNDLATKYPELVKEWNYEKNGDLKPEDVTCGSGKKIWWKCKKGHEWQTVIYDRLKKGTDCPYCSNRKVLQGFNDLAFIRLDLAKEWNYEKNGDLKPEDVTCGSEKKVWWKCKKGHEWQAQILGRSSRNRGCPYCCGRYAIKGETDLITKYPELVKEWNYEKNGDLKPEDVTCGSEKKSMVEM